MTDQSVNWPNTCYGTIPQQTLHSLPLQNPFLSASPPITGHQFWGLQGKSIGSMHRHHNQPCLLLHYYRKAAQMGTAWRLKLVRRRGCRLRERWSGEREAEVSQSLSEFQFRSEGKNERNWKFERVKLKRACGY